MPEIVVSCGGLRSAEANDETRLALDTNAPDGAAPKVNLHLGQITRRMVEDIPDRLADLLEIACYVFCADQFAQRDTPEMRDMGATWYRRFRFRIPVRDLATWRRTEVRDALVETLSFLSEDEYAFEFVQQPSRAGLQPYLDLQGDGAPAGFDPDRIIMFSGGLDSFAGAAEALLERGERVALVSHQSSTMVRSKQIELVDALRQQTRPGQLFHVSVIVNKGSERAVEFTQRSRSFLFAALGFVVARLFRKSEVLFFENGIVSVNLPVAEHVLGARATRTTHPRVLAGFDRLFSELADESIRVANPFFWRTKADVVRTIANLNCRELIPLTFSCARVREATQLKQHCGVCSQCIDRRFGVLAAGVGDVEPADLYAVDLFTGARRPGPDLVYAVSYVLAAINFAKMTSATFLSRYGQVFRALPFLDGKPAENAARLHDLHARHGRAVTGVVDKHLRRTTVQALLDLPESSLLSLIQAQTARQPAYVDPAETEPPAPEQAAMLTGPELVRPLVFGVDEDRSEAVFAGGVPLSGRGFELFSALLTEFRADRDEDRLPAEHRFVLTRDLAKRLAIDEPSLRQLMRRTRKALVAGFRERRGIVLGFEDVIETNKWKGYRLSPYLEEQPVSAIDMGLAAQAGHVTTFRSRCHDSQAGTLEQ